MQKNIGIRLASLICLGLIWISHAIGIFTPEVGFDAVWYHLPVIDAVVHAGKLVYIPELYQSVNPLLSDLLFGVGYALSGELGVKVVAYIFGLVLVCATYFLACEHMSKQWATITALVVSTFQVIAWQSSSFYVDVAKAGWEIVMMWFLVRWHSTEKQSLLWVAALLLGASLATKLFSLFLLPIFGCMVVILQKRNWVKNCVISVLLAVAVPLPFYVFSFYHTGSPWYSLTQHTEKIGEIGSGSSMIAHLLARTLELWKAPLELFLARDYTTILLFVFFPLAVKYWQLIWNEVGLRCLVVWSIAQLLLWWYLPPLSTRYALSGFITLTILCMRSAEWYAKKQREWPLFMAIALAVIINMVPRVFVNYRSLQFILGNQTKEQYIRQFYDGHLDQHLQRWHKLDESIS